MAGSFTFGADLRSLSIVRAGNPYGLCFCWSRWTSSPVLVFTGGGWDLESSLSRPAACKSNRRYIRSESPRKTIGIVLASRQTKFTEPCEYLFGGCVAAEALAFQPQGALASGGVQVARARSDVA